LIRRDGATRLHDSNVGLRVVDDDVLRLNPHDFASRRHPALTRTRPSTLAHASGARETTSSGSIGTAQPALPGGASASAAQTSEAAPDTSSAATSSAARASASSSGAAAGAAA
jgi:hypothetical protein